MVHRSLAEVRRVTRSTAAIQAQPQMTSAKACHSVAQGGGSIRSMGMWGAELKSES